MCFNVLNYKLFIQCYPAMRKRNANRPKNNNKTATTRHNKANPIFIKCTTPEPNDFFSVRLQQ